MAERVIDLIHDYINTANLVANLNLLQQIHLRLRNTLDEIKKAIKGLKILIVIYNLVIKNSVQGNLDYAYNLRLGENIGSLSYEHISEYKEHPLYENWNKIIKNGKRNPKKMQDTLLKEKNFEEAIENYLITNGG